MANFGPMRDRFLHLLRDNLQLFGVRGRFLDYGAGLANTSRFLLDHCSMTSGLAYDPAFAEEEARRAASASLGPGLRLSDQLATLEAPVDLAILFDVIEHVPDPAQVLEEIHGCVRNEGWLALTVPYNAHEWGDDDEFYGHLRRMSRQGIVTLLERSGWNVIRVLDPTVPTFWLARRSYLLLRRLRGTSFGLEPEIAGSDLERSLRSPRHVAWNPAGLFPRLLAADLVPWDLVRRFYLYFESVFRGFELFVVCQKRDGGEPSCEVCAVGVGSFHRFFDRYSLQKCGYCGSERVLPEHATAQHPSAEEKTYPRSMERLVTAQRRRRARHVAACRPPENSILDVASGSGGMLKALHEQGWRIAGTASSEKIAARVRGDAPAASVVVGDMAELPGDAAYGVVTLFHVIEHAPDLRRALEQLDRLVLPGGYLILEYPNGNSLLKKLLGWRWFGYDPPHHRLQINPVVLADSLGLKNFRLLRETHFSFEYSFLCFAQSLANLLLPFQRDSFYRWLCGRARSRLGGLWAALSVVIFALAVPLFLAFQPLASVLRRGCVVRQVFKKTDFVVPRAARSPSPQERSSS